MLSDITELQQFRLYGCPVKGLVGLGSSAVEKKNSRAANLLNLVRKLGQEFQSEAISRPAANDGGDSGPTQCLKFDFGQVSGIEMDSRA